MLLTGDLAFLHDLSGLLAAAREDVPLTVVVLDNGGGGIFSMLPEADVVPPDVFERLYTTPHRADIPALARASGARCLEPKTVEELAEATAGSIASGGPAVVYVRVDPDAGIATRQRLAAAVAAG